MSIFDKLTRALPGELRHSPQLPPKDDQRVPQSQAVSPRVTDTEGAIEDMRLAHSYLGDWENKATGDVLSHAAKYLELARAKDSNAKLTIEETGDGKTALETYTIDDLAGRTLFYRAQTHYYPDDRKSLESARDILNKAIAYAPYSIQYRAKLADIFLDLHDKKMALAVAEEAVAVSPQNLDARKLLDRIEAAPVTHPPSPISTSTAITLVAITLAVFGIIALFSGEFSTALGLWVFAAILGGIRRFLERDEMLTKAMRHQQDELQRKRKQ